MSISSTLFVTNLHKTIYAQIHCPPGFDSMRGTLSYSNTIHRHLPTLTAKYAHDVDVEITKIVDCFQPSSMHPTCPLLTTWDRGIFRGVDTLFGEALCFSDTEPVNAHNVSHAVHLHMFYRMCTLNPSFYGFDWFAEHCFNTSATDMIATIIPAYMEAAREELKFRFYK